LIIKIYPSLIQQYKVNWCKNEDTNKFLPFDFVIPDYKIIIELDGLQHFKQVAKWKTPEHTHMRDKYKMKCANDNDFSMIRILQDDVWLEKYNWLEELKTSIEKIKLEKKVQNIFLCRNDEYKIFN
jgi:very-short-patch-repair endonuclease